MQKELVFATNNIHKLTEIRAILGEKCRVKSLRDIGCEADIPETADTLEGNALQKARWVADRYGCDCFADDTGLEVTALRGEPGVLSARYAAANSCGEAHDATANSALLLQRMAGVADRSARFRTVIALVINDKEYTVEGVVNGSISDVMRGHDGFGYDPLFIPEGKRRTFAEMTADEKNAISHRRKAAEALLTCICSLNDKEKAYT